MVKQGTFNTLKRGHLLC